MNELEKILLEKWLTDQTFINWVNLNNKEDCANWELYFNSNPQHWELGKKGKMLVLGIPFKEIKKDRIKATESFQSVMNRVNKNKRSLRKPKLSLFANVAKIAASLAFLLTISFFTYINFFQDKETLLATSYGEQLETILPDGSEVILNANSSLKYSTINPRKVWLEGEAFFEIKKKPKTGENFEVYTNDLKVTVLGTAFNVNARNDKTKVFLEEGKVDLEVEDPETGTIKMIPGDLVTYSKKEKILEEKKNNASSIENSSWKLGALIFNETPLTEALHEIEDIYGIQFVLEFEMLKNDVITGGVPINNLKVTLEMLYEVYGLQIKEVGNRYYIKKS